MKIYKENYFDVNVPFQKKNRCFNKRISILRHNHSEIKDYHYHLENFGLTWKHAPLEFKYEITSSADEKTLTKKVTMGESKIDKEKIR